MSGLLGKEVCHPGAYEWVDAEGQRHLGFVFRDKRDKLHGSFVREDGASKAISLKYGDDDYCEGVFFGPLPAKS